jgi:hypothetical protein
MAALSTIHEVTGRRLVSSIYSWDTVSMNWPTLTVWLNWKKPYKAYNKRKCDSVYTVRAFPVKFFAIGCVVSRNFVTHLIFCKLSWCEIPPTSVRYTLNAEALSLTFTKRSICENNFLPKQLANEKWGGGG